MFMSKGHVFGRYCTAGYITGKPNVELLLRFDPGSPDVTED